MRTFNILAIAALAYTASADKIKAHCKVMNANNEEQGRIGFVQEVNLNVPQPTIVNLGIRDLESAVIHDLMILENDGEQECLFAATETPIYSAFSFLSSPAGMAGGRGLVDRSLNLSVEEHDGQFVALVEDGLPVACCVLEVKECNADDMNQN